MLSLNKTIIIILIIFNSMFVLASPKGLPFLCPVAVNEANINDYWDNIASQKYPEGKDSCVYENERIACDEAREKLISEKTTQDRIKVEEEIKECKSYFESIKASYQESASNYCSKSDMNYFIADHTPPNQDSNINGVDISWNSNNPPIWEYDRYTGELNGVKQYSHNSLEGFYWKEGECPYYDAIEDYNISKFNEVSEPLYKSYCNNIKKDNKETYENCWTNNKYRSCNNDCENQFAYWELPQYETEQIEKMSLDYSDCLIACQEYQNSFKDCMHKNFEEEYCWIPSYLGNRNLLIRYSSKYYRISEGTSKKDEFLTRAYQNKFYQYAVHSEGIELEFKCPEGMEYDETKDICYTIETGKSSVKFVLDSESYDASKENSITGTATHVCEDDCPGTNVYLQTKAEEGSSVSFNIEYSGDTFLTKDNPKVDFKIILNHYNALYDGTDAIKIKIYQDIRSPQYFKFYPAEVKDFKIIPSSWNIKQEDKINIHVEVDGPKDIPYTYVLTSALDATFYYNGEEHPIATIITKKENQLDFEYKPPMISRIVNARDFYLDELGELSVGLARSSIKGISSMMLGSALASKLSGVEVKGYELTSNVIDGSLANADGLMTFGMDGFLPASFSLMAIAGEKAGAVGAVGDISYQAYQAYSRADERFKAFATTTEHVYTVPIKVSVKGEGYPPIERAIKINVTAPEAIVK